ncbi:MAG: transposase [Thermoplasmatales archaeon]
MRCSTLRSYKTSEEKFEVIMESINTNITVTELCRKYGTAPSLYYKWRDQFFAGSRNGLAGNNPDKALEKEVEQLKTMIGDQAMVIDVFKKA